MLVPWNIDGATKGFLNARPTSQSNYDMKRFHREALSSVRLSPFVILVETKERGQKRFDQMVLEIRSSSERTNAHQEGESDRSLFLVLSKQVWRLQFQAIKLTFLSLKHSGWFM